MTIEIKDKKEIDLILQDILYTPGLHSNLISILRICNMSINVVFGTNNVVARLDDEYTAI